MEEINNISELCSEVDEEENSGSEDSIYDPLDTDSERFGRDNEGENTVNTRRGRKRMRLFSSSEDECEENDQNIETSVDGTVLPKNSPRFWTWKISASYNFQRNIRANGICETQHYEGQSKECIFVDT